MKSLAKNYVKGTIQSVSVGEGVSKLEIVDGTIQDRTHIIYFHREFDPEIASIMVGMNAQMCDQISLINGKSYGSSRFCQSLVVGDPECIFTNEHIYATDVSLNRARSARVKYDAMH